MAQPVSYRAHPTERLLDASWLRQWMYSSINASTSPRVYSSRRPGWTDSTFIPPRKPSAAASSGERPFAPVDPVDPNRSMNRKMDGIMRLARRLPLTRQVLADQLETATPAQMEFVDRWMNAEIESREASKRTRLLRQAGFPAAKELDGYDWQNVRMPADWQRSGLESLGFLDGPEDVAVFGPAGTGRTHLAIALGRKACRQGVPVRFYTAAGLVMRPLRATRKANSTGNCKPSPRPA